MDEPPSYSFLNILADQSLLYYFFTALLLFFSAWASAVEAAFFSLKADDIEQFRHSGNGKQKITASLLKEPRLLLTVLTTCKYALLLAAAILAMAAFAWKGITGFSGFSLAIGILALTVCFGIFGVILAKIYGNNFSVSIALKNSRICQGLVTAIGPVVAPIIRMSLRVERALAAKFEQNSVEEFTRALQLATIGNEPVEGEKEILEGIVNFGTLRVKQVMRPRPEISYTDLSLDFHQLMDFIKRSGYSRVPVCEGTLDKLRGLLYIKDVLPFLKESAQFDWRKLLRPAYFVQETKKVDFLLKDFQEKRVHIALVVNQNGQISGLITLEDIIEEIIGDINDEFDEIGSRFQRLDERTFLFDGKTSVHEFCKVMTLSPDTFYPLKGINESLSSVILEIRGTLPVIGEKITVGPLTFVIEAVDQKRIKKVRVQVNESKVH